MRTTAPYHLVALSLVLGTSAWASSNYPGVISAEAGATRVSQCIVCHANNAGGTGTATKAFVEALRERGLPNSNNQAALITAFQQLETDGIDSDADGTIDTDEITAYRDPNIALDVEAGVDDCQTPGQCEAEPGTDGGTDGGDGGDGGVLPEPLPDVVYGAGCTSTGGMQALGGLLFLGAAALRVLRRRD